LRRRKRGHDYDQQKENSFFHFHTLLVSPALPNPGNAMLPLIRIVLWLELQFV
jgi:hypothetical protein